MYKNRLIKLLLILLALCALPIGCSPSLVGKGGSDGEALPLAAVQPVQEAGPAALAHSPAENTEPAAAPEQTPEPGPAATPEPTPEPTPAPVVFAQGEVAPDTEELTLVLAEGETPLLDQLPGLKRLDASGSTNYEELAAWGEAHPEVALHYTLPLPDGQVLDNTAEAADLTGLTGELLEDTIRMLSFVPNLRQVELGSPDAGTRLNAAELQALQAALPGAELHYVVTLMGKELDPDTESLDLTELTSEEVPSAAAALSGLSKLRELTLPGGDYGLSLEDALTLAAAAPEALIHYPVSVYGRSFDLSDEGLDLNHVPISDQGEAIRRLLPFMRACTWLDMDSCGVDNAHMAVIRDENPNVEVIWRVNFGTNYSVRTNVTKILASMPSKGGTLYDDVGEALQYCTKVRYLDLGHNEHITDFGFIRCMPELEVVVISMTGISDLSPFTACPNLLYMEAGNTKLYDLSPLAECKSLKHLNIGTNIGIRDISPLYELDLKRLWIGSYTPVPAEQVAEMQERHPNCIINTSVPSGLERDANGNVLNEGYVLGWKNYQNYLTVDWNFYSAYGYFPAQRPIGWYKVIYKCFEYNLGTGAYAFSWNDPKYNAHDPSVMPVNTFVLDTSFLNEDWEDPGSIIPDVLDDPPGELLYRSEH